MNLSGIRLYFAQKTTIKELHLFLAKNERRYNRAALAKNESIDLDIQLILANDEDSYVAAHLACNENIHEKSQIIICNLKGTPPIYLATNLYVCHKAQYILASERLKSDLEIRWHLARNPNISREVQLILAEDKMCGVMAGLKNNKNVDLDIKNRIKV